MEYKVGDRVRVKSLEWYNENKDEDGDVFCGEYDFVDLMTKFCGKVVTIENCYEHDCYTIKEDNEGFVFTGEMFEGLAEEISQEDKFNEAYQEMIKEADEKFKNHERPKASGVCQECVFAVNDNNPHCGLRGFRNDFNVKSCSAKNSVIPNGFELQNDGYFSWINKKEYPKTYEECCEILGLNNLINMHLSFMDENTKITASTNYHIKTLILLNCLTKLRICCDAYWKIAGEEMGLGKPWEPDWNDEKQDKYGFYNEVKYTIINPALFVFPTEEMRDAFKENFDKDLEFCKEFL